VTGEDVQDPKKVLIDHWLVGTDRNSAFALNPTLGVQVRLKIIKSKPNRAADFVVRQASGVHPVGNRPWCNLQNPRDVIFCEISCDARDAFVRLRHLFGGIHGVKLERVARVSFYGRRRIGANKRVSGRNRSVA